MNNHDDDGEKVAYEDEPWRPAVQSGDVQQLQDLIQERGLAVLTRNSVSEGSDMTTALLVAVRENHMAMVQYLLEHCRSAVDIDAVDWVYGGQMSYTALHIATAKGNVEMVRYLIRQGMDVNINPKNGDCRSTALYVAAWYNQIEVFRCLLETPGCNIDGAVADDETEDDEDKDTLWSIVILSNNLSMVQTLMDYYSKLNTELAKTEAQVALHMACGKNIGGLEIFKYFVETCQVDLEAILDHENEVDKEEEDDDDDEMDVDTKATPLLKACQSRNLDIIQYLVSRGAKMDAKDKDGDSVLHLSVTRVDIVQYFVETHGVDVEQPNLKGNTVLHCACRSGSVAMVRYLVGATCNANVNVVNSDGETPLHMASRNDCLEAAQCIVESGRCTSINAQDNNGQTPLHISANHDYRFDMTLYWFDTASADMTVRDKDGNTALHIAAARGRYGRRTVLFLVSRMSADDFEDDFVSVGPGLSKRQKIQ